MKHHLFLLLVLFSLGCSNDHAPQTEDLKHLKACGDLQACDKCVIIDKKLYQETLTNNYKINSAVVQGNCLEIEYSASGCSGDSWELELMDSGVIMESFPVQRSLRLRLRDSEACEAYITKTISFNIEPLQVEGGQAVLHLQGWGEGIEYKYQTGPE